MRGFSLWNCPFLVSQRPESLLETRAHHLARIKGRRLLLDPGSWQLLLLLLYYLCISQQKPKCVGASAQKR